MKILHVITGLQKAAGTSVFAGEVCNALVERGHEVTLAVCNPRETDLYPLDARVHLVPIDSFFEPGAISEFSLVHIHALWSLALVRVAKATKRAGRPLIWSPHGMLTPWAMGNKRLKKWLGWWCFQRSALEAADILHATAESEVADIRRMGLSSQVAVVPLGVHLGAEKNPSAMKNVISRRTLLFVSRVQRKKGLPMLLEAWSKLPPDLRTGWQIRIVGPDQDHHTEELMSLCRKLAISYSQSQASSVSEVVFVGPRYGTDLDAEYDSADLFVLPTYSENFGSVVIEALSHGLPVVCTKGAPWSVLEGVGASGDGRCGWWIDIGVDPLVETLRKAFSLPNEQIDQMRRNGRLLVREAYAWDSIVDRLVNVYERAV